MGVLLNSKQHKLGLGLLKCKLISAPSDILALPNAICIYKTCTQFKKFGAFGTFSTNKSIGSGPWLSLSMRACRKSFHTLIPTMLEYSDGDARDVRDPTAATDDGSPFQPLLPILLHNGLDSPLPQPIADAEDDVQSTKSTSTTIPKQISSRFRP